jgi:hypothetical protein
MVLLFGPEKVLGFPVTSIQGVVDFSGGLDVVLANKVEWPLRAVGWLGLFVIFSRVGSAVVVGVGSFFEKFVSQLLFYFT